MEKVMHFVDNDTSVDRSFLLTLLESINDLFYVTDENGCFVSIYGTLLQKHGFGRENFIGRILFEIFGKDPGGLHKNAHQRCLNGKSFTYDWEFEYNDESFFFQTALSPINSSHSSYKGCVGIIRNITRQKEIELIHDEVTLKFRTLANAANLSIISLNEADKIEYCNSATELVFGYSPEELLDHDFSKLINFSGCTYSLKNVLIQSGAEDKSTFELEGKKKNGEIFPLEVTVASYSVLNMKHHVIILQDISSRKKFEQEILDYSKKLEEQNKELEIAFEALKNMQTQLLHSEKLASIGQLTSGIAHEINNPLAFVSSNLNRFYEYFNDILLVTDAWREFGQGVPLNEEEKNKILELERKVDLEFIREDFKTLTEHNRSGIDRIQNIVLQLRGFSRDSSNSNIETDLNAALDDTLTIAWNELKYKAEIIKEYGDIPLLRCNPNEIKQVMLNLIINAAHAIEKNGKITLRTYDDNKHIYLVVADNGKGIDPEMIKNIFDPFFTTKPPGMGTGLGLWICLTIIQKHRASIDVNSAPGKGAVFTIKFRK